MVATDWAMTSCLSRNYCFQGLVFLWTLFHPIKGGKIPLGYSYAGLDIQETLEGHSRLYLSMVLMLFQARKTPPICFVHLYAPHYVIATKTTHLVVGYTLRDTVSNSEVNRTDGPKIQQLLYHPSPKISSIWPLSNLHLRHGLRTDTNATTTHLPVCPGHSRCHC